MSFIDLFLSITIRLNESKFFSIDRWILPTASATHESPIKVPYTFTVSYWRQNLPYLIFMMWYCVMNVVFFSTHALAYNHTNVLYMLARGAGIIFRQLNILYLFIHDNMFADC